MWCRPNQISKYIQYLHIHLCLQMDEFIFDILVFLCHGMYLRRVIAQYFNYSHY